MRCGGCGCGASWGAMGMTGWPPRGDGCTARGEGAMGGAGVCTGCAMAAAMLSGARAGGWCASAAAVACAGAGPGAGVGAGGAEPTEGFSGCEGSGAASCLSPLSRVDLSFLVRDVADTPSVLLLLPSLRSDRPRSLPLPCLSLLLSLPLPLRVPTGDLAKKRG